MEEGTPAAAHEREERTSAVIHGVGAALSIAGLTLLVTLAARTDAFRLASAIVYGIALLLLYSASTVYHLVREPRVKRAFRVLDHAAIYVLIAGTYTPFTLVTLRGQVGWMLFAAIWVLALVGVVVETAWLERPRGLATFIYLAMGWMVLIAHRPLGHVLPDGGIALLLAGGLVYTAGTVFYLLYRVRYMHAIWHAFVLAGSVCHYVAVARYVLPAG